MNWFQVGFGVFVLLSAANLRIQLRWIRRSVEKRGGDIGRWDRFEHSRLVKWMYVGLPVLGVLAIITGLLGG